MSRRLWGASELSAIADVACSSSNWSKHALLLSCGEGHDSLGGSIDARRKVNRSVELFQRHRFLFTRVA